MGASQNAQLDTSDVIGYHAGSYLKASLSSVRGAYCGNYSSLKNSLIDGYAIEFCEAENTTLTGLYAGHSASLIDSTGNGVGALSNAIGSFLIAHGRNAGAGAEGKHLTMMGANVTTAFIPGKRHSARVKSSGNRPGPAGDIARWEVPNHGWKHGSRRNFAIEATIFPKNQTRQPWIAGIIYPFTVLDDDNLIYTGNKYVALDEGNSVFLIENSNRPENSIALGAGSMITQSNQIIINGVDVSRILRQ